jgi:hypothetical protein
MDFLPLQRLTFDVLTSNQTETTNSVPSMLLESLIPGYGIFSSIISRLFGFDIGLVVSGCLVVFGLFKGGQILYLRAFQAFSSYFTSSVVIEGTYSKFRALKTQTFSPKSETHTPSLVWLKKPALRIYQILSNKVYLKGCLKDDIEITRDLISMLNLLLYLRY